MRTAMWLGVLAMGVLAGCGPDAGKYCAEWSDCAGGNDDDEEACLVQFDFGREAAGIVGCTSEHDAYFDCFLEHATCQNDDLGIACPTGTECATLGLDGATCVAGTCQVPDYGLEDPKVCDPEDNAFEGCMDFSVGIP